MVDAGVFEGISCYLNNQEFKLLLLTRVKLKLEWNVGEKEQNSQRGTIQLNFYDSPHGHAPKLSFFLLFLFLAFIHSSASAPPSALCASDKIS